MSELKAAFNVFQRMNTRAVPVSFGVVRWLTWSWQTGCIEPFSTIRCRNPHLERPSLDSVFCCGNLSLKYVRVLRARLCNATWFSLSDNRLRVAVRLNRESRRLDPIASPLPSATVSSDRFDEFRDADVADYSDIGGAVCGLSCLTGDNDGTASRLPGDH